MGAFCLGMLAALLPSAGVFGWMIWKYGIGDAPEEVGGQVLSFPKMQTERRSARTSRSA
jgi:hypothetical protein